MIRELRLFIAEKFIAWAFLIMPESPEKINFAKWIVYKSVSSETRKFNTGGLVKSQDFSKILHPADFYILPLKGKK